MDGNESRTLFTRIGVKALRSRRLMRAPVWIFRAHAGAVLGNRVLMLEHIGRKSGRTRYAVLEVIDNPVPELYVVASGFGRRAQWYRNIEAGCHVRVYAGSHPPTPADARILSPPEADRALAAYRSRHPEAWERFKQVLEETLGVPVTDTDTPLPMVELRLRPKAPRA